MMLVSFICPVLFGIPMATAMFAKSQGRNPFLWFALAFLLPVISLIILFCLPDKPAKTETVAE